MARKSFVLLIVGITVLFLCSVSIAVVPDKISYQGKLASSGGGCLNDTVSMTFSIYPTDDVPHGTPGDWVEDQDSVIVKEGIFNVLLGSVNPIPASIFDGRTMYLGVQVESDLEMRPLKPMVSVAYAYRAGTVDGGGGNCEDCDTVFVNVAGPDSVVSTTGTAFLGKVSGGSETQSVGVEGYAENNSYGSAYGGYFTTSELGEGYHHVGIWAEARSSASPYAIGAYGHAENQSGYDAYGGWFATSSMGTGDHYGLYAYGGADPDVGGTAYGVVASASSPTLAYGGYFEAYDDEQGKARGVHALGSGNSAYPTYGTYSYANNYSSGDVYGGAFVAEHNGTGLHYGVYAESRSEATSRNYGTYSYANNQTTGDCFAGYFLADDEGTGTDAHIGVRGEAVGTASATAYGVMGYGENTSTGPARGGHFVAQSSGTGVHYGVFGSEAAGGGGAAVYASGDFAGSGAKYAVVKTGRGHRLLSCMESPEIWFEDFGEGKLVNGKAHVELDPLFLETVTINAEHPMQVFVQLHDENCKGTAVKRGTTGFDVIELSGGTSNASFSYRIVAKRKGYENERLRETDVGYDDPALYPELKAQMDKEYQAEKQQQRLEREKRRQDEERRSEERRRMEEKHLDRPRAERK